MCYPICRTFDWCSLLVLNPFYLAHYNPEMCTSSDDSWGAAKNDQIPQVHVLHNRGLEDMRFVVLQHIRADGHCNVNDVEV